MTFLIDAVDITDQLLLVVDLIDSIRHINGFIQAVEGIAKPGLNSLQHRLSAPLGDRDIDCLIAGGLREEPCHIPVGIIQITADSAPGRVVSGRDK